MELVDDAVPASDPSWLQHRALLTPPNASLHQIPRVLICGEDVHLDEMINSFSESVKDILWGCTLANSKALER